MQSLPKFRGYSLRLKKWLYGDLLHYQNQLAIIPFDSDWLNVIGELKLLNIDYVVDKESVGQSTGLFDKNGKEVFKGDILRIPAKSEYEKTTFNSFEVFYHHNDGTPTDCGLVLGRLKTHGHSAGGYCGYKLIPKDVNKMEIIANKFENPDLLNPNN